MPDFGDLKIPYPNTSEAPDGPAAILAMATRLDEVVSGAARLVADATARTSISSGEKFPGMMVRQLDTMQDYLWDGSVWLLPSAQVISGGTWSNSSGKAVPTYAGSLTTIDGFTPYSVVDSDYVGYGSGTFTLKPAGWWSCSVTVQHATDSGLTAVRALSLTDGDIPDFTGLYITTKGSGDSDFPSSLHWSGPFYSPSPNATFQVKTAHKESSSKTVYAAMTLAYLGPAPL